MDEDYTTRALAEDQAFHGAMEQTNGSWLHADGDIYYYNSVGQVHREDGPAIVEYPYNTEHWYIYGQEYSFNKWLNILPLPDKEKMILKLRYS